MKKRAYVYCPDCRGVRMRLVGESADGKALLAIAVERYYHCPGCGLQRAYDIRRKAFLSRAPKRVPSSSR